MVSGTGSNRLTLQLDLYVGGLCLGGKCGIGLYALQKILTALGVFDVFDAQVDSLGHDAVTDAFVDDHSDGALGDVVHNARLSNARYLA